MMERIVSGILDAAAQDGWVLEPDAKRLLQDAGLEVPRGRLATSVDDAVDAARELGFSAVAKVVSPAVVHKTEVGGVIVGLPGEDAVRAAWARLSPLPEFRGLLIEELVSGVEAIVGGRYDPQFGPVVMLGVGGTGVEIYRDISLRLAPVDEAEAAAMLAELTGAALFTGHRGSASVDVPALARLIARFSALLAALGDRVSSVDLNPVFCGPRRAVIGDARFLLEG
jgi:acetate---CoA ligase (ADP-forming) subunit beta